MGAIGLPVGSPAERHPSGGVAALGIAWPVNATRAGNSTIDAPDVVVLAEPSLAPAIRAVGRSFHARTGVPVRVFEAPGFALAAEVARRARSDVLVLASAAMDKAGQNGLLLPGTRLGGFTTPLVIAGAAGEKPLQQLSAAALLQRLGGRRFARPDQTIASPIDSRAVLQRLGLAEALSGRTIGGALNADIAFYLRRGEAAFGLLYLADARASGLSVAASLPPARDNPARFEAALVKIRLSRFAQAFLDFLHSPAARAPLLAAGVTEG